MQSNTYHHATEASATVEGGSRPFEARPNTRTVLFNAEATPFPTDMVLSGKQRRYFINEFNTVKEIMGRPKPKKTLWLKYLPKSLIHKLEKEEDEISARITDGTPETWRKPPQKPLSPTWDSRGGAGFMCSSNQQDVAIMFAFGDHLDEETVLSCKKTGELAKLIIESFDDLLDFIVSDPAGSRSTRSEGALEA